MSQHNVIRARTKGEPINLRPLNVAKPPFCLLDKVTQHTCTASVFRHRAVLVVPSSIFKAPQLISQMIITCVHLGLGRKRETKHTHTHAPATNTQCDIESLNTQALKFLGFHQWGVCSLKVHAFSAE